eukprot:9098970-Alexandrium_andersonii.AAC.1
MRRASQTAAGMPMPLSPVLSSSSLRPRTRYTKVRRRASLKPRSWRSLSISRRSLSTSPL